MVFPMMFVSSVMEFVNGHDGLVEFVRQLDLLEGEAKGRMRAKQIMRIRIIHKLHDPINLAYIARRAQVVLRIDMPVGEKAIRRQMTNRIQESFPDTVLR